MSDRKLTPIFRDRDRVMNAAGGVYAVIDVKPSEEGDPRFPFRYKIVGPEGIFARHEIDLLAEYVLLPHPAYEGFIGNQTTALKTKFSGNLTESQPYFYTGLTGPAHFEAAKNGRSFLAVLTRMGHGWAIMEDDPNNRWFAADRVNGADWSSWCRIRAADANAALKLANNCEDQMEHYHNGDENWLEIAAVPIDERVF